MQPDLKPEIFQAFRQGKSVELISIWFDVTVEEVEIAIRSSINKLAQEADVAIDMNKRLTEAVN